MNSFADPVLYTFVALLAVLILVLVGMILIGLARLIFLSFTYGEVKTMPGKIVDQDFTAGTTHSHTQPNGVTTFSRTADSFEVTIETELKTTVVEAEALFMRCRIGEAVELTYQDRFATPRFWNGETKLDGHRLLKIKAQGGVVRFNSKKPVVQKKTEVRTTRVGRVRG